MSDFDFPVETDDGFMVYKYEDGCPECGGELVKQRHMSDGKEINGETVIIKGTKCKNCSRTVNVLASD